MEIWKYIEGHENYLVSNIGNIKRIYKNGKEKILKRCNRKGYLTIRLYNGSALNYDTMFVHRLVAAAFIPNLDNLPCVNHKDENKLNNNVDNLEWCTRKYNNNYGTRTKRAREKLLNRSDLSKYIYCIELDKIFVSIQEAERQTKIPHSNIIKVCKGERKTAGGYHWKYKN